MAVIPCDMLIGCILAIIQEESVIPIAMAGSTSTKPIADFIN